MVNAMQSIRFTVVAICSVLCMWPQYGFAKTYAYFIGQAGKIARLDTDTNAVTQLTLKTPSNVDLDKVLGADTVNKLFYITHCVRLGPCRIGVYGLNTLNFIKELPIIADEPDVQMVIYPDGSKFLVQYLFADGASGGKGYTTDLYDAKTLSMIKNLQTFFAMEDVMFSSDKKKIYSVVGGDDAKVNVIDSSTFQVLASRDLTQIWRQDVFAADVESFDNGKILISEDLKKEKNLPDKLDFYIYDIESGGLSPKISTGLQGNLTLTSGGTKIILDENQDIREVLPRGSKAHLMGFKSLGRIHIYDVATGKELRMIFFKVQGEGKIRGIRPAGDRLYYESEGSTKDSSNITIIDIKNYQVLTTISLPFKPLTTIFFEQ